MPIVGIPGQSSITFPDLTNLQRGLTIYGAQDSPITLDADVAGGDTELTLDTTSLADGDFLLLRDPDTLIVPSGTASGNRKTEFVEILTVDDANTVTLKHPTRHSYTTAANSVAHKTTMAERPFVAGIRLIGPDDPEIAVIGIEFRDCLRPYFRDVEAFACNNRGLNFIRCLGPGGEHFYAEGTVGEDDSNGSQYGIGVVDSCQNGWFADIRARYLRHAVTVGGDTCNTVIVDGGVAEGMYDAGWDCHPGSADIHYINQWASGTETDGLVFQSSSGSIRNFRSYDAGRHGLLVQSLDTFAYRLVVDGVRVVRPGRADGTGRGVNVSTDQSCLQSDFLDFDDIEVYSYPDYAFRVSNGGPNLLPGLRLGKIEVDAPVGQSFAVSIQRAQSPEVRNPGIDRSLIEFLSCTDVRISPPDVGKHFGIAQALAGAPASAIPSAGGDYFVVPVIVDERAVITGARYRVGATSQGNASVALYSPTGATKLGESSSTAQGTANQYDNRDFAAPVTLEPGRYWVALRLSSVSGTAMMGRMLLPTLTANGGLPSSITPPTTPENADRPIVSLY